MPTKKLALALAGTVTVMAGSAAAYWHFVKGAADPLSPVTLAKLVPQETYAAAYVSADAQNWSKLEQFGTAAARQNLQKGLQDLQQQMIKENQIDPSKDLAWVGDVMLAVMPPTGASNTDPDLLMVMGVKDKISALNFAKKLENQSDTKLTRQQYKGTEISHFAQDGADFYAAVLGNYLIASPEQMAIERSIDTQQGQPSLAAQSKAEPLLTQTLVSNSVARFYILDYAAAMQDLMTASPTPMPSTLLTQFQQVKSVVADLGIDDLGLRLKAQTDLDSSASTAQAVNTQAAGQVLSQFPTDTLALVSGAALNQYWSQMVQQANTTSEAQLAVGGMRQAAKAYLNLDLDREVFSWMDGEFGMGLVPAQQGIFSQLGVGGRLVFDTSNRKAADATLTKLDKLAKQMRISVGPRQLKGSVKGATVTEWGLPGQGALLQHGWLDNDSLFVAIGGPDPLKTAGSLDNNDSFKAVTASLPKQNMGYFYLNVEKMLPLMNRAQLVSQAGSQTGSQSQTAAQKAEAEALLDSMRSIAITSAQPSKTVSEIEMLLTLKPAQK